MSTPIAAPADVHSQVAPDGAPSPTVGGSGAVAATTTDAASPMAPAAPAPSPPVSTRSGDIRVHENVGSRFLESKRTVLVYLPPGYEADQARRYPVLYLQDGQNVFDAATAFGGKEWSVDETAQRLIGEGAIEPLIIVAVDNAGERRIEEYTPTRDSKQDAGGGAEAYGRMLVEELKPMIDGAYRTRPEVAQTGIGGSSLGGLLSMYLVLKHRTVFGRAAVISPSVWWDDQMIIRQVGRVRSRPASRIWLSIGTAEGDEALDAARRLREALISRGWRLGQDFFYAEFEGAGHGEEAWAAQIADVLKALYPQEKQQSGQ